MMFYIVDIMLCSFNETDSGLMGKIKTLHRDYHSLFYLLPLQSCETVMKLAICCSENLLKMTSLPTLVSSFFEDCGAGVEIAEICEVLAPEFEHMLHTEMRPQWYCCLDFINDATDYRFQEMIEDEVNQFIF